MKPFLFIVFGLCTTASARLMESKDDCLKRYGTPARTKGDESVWIKEGIKITALFHRDACQKISYEKLQPDAKFSQVELETLLEANKNGRSWESSGGFFTQGWKTSEGWYVATYDAQKGLTLMTAYYQNIEEKAAEQEAEKARKAAENEAAKKAAAEKKKLEGF